MMIVCGLVFLVSGLISALDQDWRNTSIADISVVLVFAPALAERWVQQIIPVNLHVLYAVLRLAGPYLSGYWYR